MIPQMLLLDTLTLSPSPSYRPVNNTVYERQQDILNYYLKQLIDKGYDIVDYGIWQTYGSSTSPYNKNTVLYIKYLKDEE